MILLGNGSEARAQRAGSAFDLEREPRRSLFLRGDAPSGPLSPSLYDRTLHGAAELRLMKSIERGTVAAIKLDFLTAPLTVMRYGILAEPRRQFQLKRDMLLFVGKLTGQAGFARAAVSLRPTTSFRGITEALALERSRNRATFLDIVELLGSGPLVSSRATSAAFALAGGALFGSGIGVHRLLHGALGDALSVYPQPWPPGIRMSGKFNAL